MNKVKTEKELQIILDTQKFIEKEYEDFCSRNESALMENLEEHMSYKFSGGDFVSHFERNFNSYWNDFTSDEFVAWQYGKRKQYK